MSKWFVKIGGALLGMDEKAKKSIDRLAEGEVVELEMRRSRSPQWNRWYWACCTEIGLNQDPPLSKDAISDELKIRSGHCTKRVILIDGTKAFIFSPKHINFRAMNADQWEDYWQRVDVVMLEHYKFDSHAFKSGW